MREDARERDTDGEARAQEPEDQRAAGTGQARAGQGQNRSGGGACGCEREAYGEPDSAPGYAGRLSPRCRQLELAAVGGGMPARTSMLR